MKCTFIIRNLNSHYFTSLKSLYSKQLIQTMIGEDHKCQFVTLNAKLIKHNKNIKQNNYFRSCDMVFCVAQSIGIYIYIRLTYFFIFKTMHIYKTMGEEGGDKPFNRRHKHKTDLENKKETTLGQQGSIGTIKDSL